MARRGKNYVSPTEINTANYCAMRHYLRYSLGKPSLRLSVYVRGSLYHSLIEHFWERLGEPDEIKKNKNGTITSQKKYHDRQSFVEYARGKWSGILAADRANRTKGKEGITWKYDNEMWVILNGMPKICRPLFDYLLNAGQPAFSELPFDFAVPSHGLRIKGRIDEVRLLNGEVIIIDYKTGKPWLGMMKLKHDPQLTIYSAGLCSLIKFDPAIREKLGLEGRVEEFMAGGKFISPNIKEAFFMIDALGIDPEKVKNVPEPLYDTKREDRHFIEVIKMIKGVKMSNNLGNIYAESGKKCDDCDERHWCDKEFEKINVGEYVDESGQVYLSLATPLYLKKEELGAVALPQMEQSKFRFQYKRGGIKVGAS